MKSPYHKTRLIIGAVGALLVVALLSTATRRYLAYSSPICGQPCPHPDERCAPVTLSMDVLPKKLSKGDFLWQKIEIRNQTCSALAVLDGHGFVETDNLIRRGHGLWVSITGPDGRELKRQPPHAADGGAAWNLGGEQGKATFERGVIHPYQFDRKAYDEALASHRLSDDWFLTLMPGESFATIPSEVRPYRIVATASDMGNGVAHGYAFAPVDNPPKFPAPPQGYREVDRYDFSRPGRYTMRAGFDGEPSLGQVYPNWDKLRKRSPKIAGWLLKLGLAPHPRWKIRALKVSIEALPVEFEVVR